MITFQDFEKAMATGQSVASFVAEAHLPHRKLNVSMENALSVDQQERNNFTFLRKKCNRRMRKLSTHGTGELTMDDTIYCVNADCPYKDCSRSILTLKDYPDKKKMVSTANLGGICRRYVYWVASKAEANGGQD